MQFSNTTNKNGLIQTCEFWTGLGDGAISGNPTLLAQFTNRINRRYEQAFAKVNTTAPQSQIDDYNYDDQPFQTFDIVSGQNDYQFLTDADGNAITDITNVLILPSTDSTQYLHLYRHNLNDYGVELYMSPNTVDTGVPSAFLERNNTIFFDVLPNYSKTAGGKIFFRRVPSYFLTTDTTKQAGFNADHHEMLALGASYDWLLVNAPTRGTLITRLEVALQNAEKEFGKYTRMRNPYQQRMSAYSTSCI